MRFLIEAEPPSLRMSSKRLPKPLSGLLLNLTASLFNQPCVGTPNSWQRLKTCDCSDRALLIVPELSRILTPKQLHTAHCALAPPQPLVKPQPSYLHAISLIVNAIRTKPICILFPSIR